MRVCAKQVDYTRRVLSFGNRLFKSKVYVSDMTRTEATRIDPGVAWTARCAPSSEACAPSASDDDDAETDEAEGDRRKSSLIVYPLRRILYRCDHHHRMPAFILQSLHRTLLGNQ